MFFKKILWKIFSFFITTLEGKMKILEFRSDKSSLAGAYHQHDFSAFSSSNKLVGQSVTKNCLALLMSDELST